MSRHRIGLALPIGMRGKKAGCRHAPQRRALYEHAFPGRGAHEPVLSAPAAGRWHAGLDT